MSWTNKKFTRVSRLSAWRRISLHLWSDPVDPTVYGNLEINMRKACEYLGALQPMAGGIKVTVTHLVAKAIAKAIAAHPEANAMIAGRRLYSRDSIDVYCQVATEGGRDLSGVKITDADSKPILEMARELGVSVDAVHRADGGSERTKQTVLKVPHALLGPLLRTVDSLSYRMRLDLSRFGVAFDQFGSAMVSNVGQFGIGHGLAPLVPSTHVPIVLLVGEVADRPVVEDGELAIAPCMTVGCTFDHRLIDGHQAGGMARIVKRTLEDPFTEIGLPSRPSSADGRVVLDRPGANSRDHRDSGYTAHTPESLTKRARPARG